MNLFKFYSGLSIFFYNLVDIYFNDKQHCLFWWFIFEPCKYFYCRILGFDSPHSTTRPTISPLSFGVTESILGQCSSSTDYYSVTPYLQRWKIHTKNALPTSPSLTTPFHRLPFPRFSCPVQQTLLFLLYLGVSKTTIVQAIGRYYLILNMILEMT